MSNLTEGVEAVAEAISKTKKEEALSVNKLVEMFKPIVTADKVAVVDGVPTLPAEVFKECQSLAGVDDNTIVRVRRLGAAFGALAHEVTGKAAVDLLVANADLEKVKTRVDMGALRSAVGVVRRQHVGTKPNTSEPIITKGSNRFTLSIISGSDVAPLNAATSAIKAYAEQVLK